MLCLLLKALVVPHCKVALYCVQQSGAASQRSVQTCLPRACVHVLLHVLKAVGWARYTWPPSGSRASFSCDSHLSSYTAAQAII
jgi:hypothetical protein